MSICPIKNFTLYSMSHSLHFFENHPKTLWLLTFERRLDRYWENQDQFYSYRTVITTGQDSLESDSEETELVQEADHEMIAFYQNLGRRSVSILLSAPSYWRVDIIL